MMLVASSTSPSPSAKRTIASSMSSAGIFPCATMTSSSGTSSDRRFVIGSMSSTRGHTTKLWPPRRRSRTSASRTVVESNGVRKVRIGRRCAGGVAMTLRSWSPTRAAWSVRGIGVAVSVRTCSSSREAAQLGFLGRPEALLLVDDHETEILEAHSLRRDRMGADHDLDGPIGEPSLTRFASPASPSATVPRPRSRGRRSGG